MFSYRISGFSVTSDIALTGLIQNDLVNDVPDIRISEGLVPENVEDDGATRGLSLASHDGRFLLHIPGVARFLLTDGCDIVFQVDPDGEIADVPIFLIGTVFGILLHQRGQIVLHASAVQVNGKAVLFLGASGAGKSTMAAALVQHGLPLVSDDLCAIAFKDNAHPLVQADGRKLKLWAEAIDQLDLPSRRGEAVRHRLEKFYVDPEQVFSEPLAIGAVYALGECLATDAPGVEAPNLVDAALLLRLNAYRPELVGHMAQKAQYFQAAISICKKAGVFRLIRPLDFSKIPEVIAVLERHWLEIGLSTKA